MGNKKLEIFDLTKGYSSKQAQKTNETNKNKRKEENKQKQTSWKTNLKQTYDGNKQKQTGRLSFIAKWWLNFRGPGGSIYISRYILRNTCKKHNE